MTVARLALALIGCGLGLIGALHATQRLQAEILVLKSEQAAERGAWISARGYAHRALQRRPDRYRVIERAALADERLGRARHARELWKQAVQARPGWPYAWAFFARAQLRDGGDPQTASIALDRVRQLGDQERGLWKLLGLTALEQADRPLDPPLRAALDEFLVREAGVAGLQLVGYALVRRREPALCAVLARREPEPWWCDAARKERAVCDQPVLALSQQKHCTEVLRRWRDMQYP